MREHLTSWWSRVPFGFQLLTYIGIGALAMPWILRYWSWVLP